jgi:hypothetical protein
VNVIVDDVVRRRTHIFGRTHIVRYRHEQRLRQVKQADGRWRRLQYHKILRRRRQIVNWRRWRRREIEIRIAEHQHRAIDIDDLIRRRRRNVIFKNPEGRRRFDGR